MKPFFIACLILVSLFTAGTMNQRTVSNISDSIRTQLDASQTAAQQEQWETAARAFSQADETWQEHEAYLHVVIEHDEIDEAEALFAEVDQYARQHDSDKYCTSAERLCTQLDHLKESQQLSIKNIL
ncbi:DUF4363 family protein [bacterium 210917-SL.2.15]|nr:DUF4363 family protein [bacterium 210917-SL.2.15]